MRDDLTRAKHAAYMRAWIADPAHPERLEKKRASDRRYANTEIGRERLNIASAKWNRNNHDRRLDIMASYRDRNRESLRERGREYYLANRERVLAGIKKWKERNPLKLAEYKGRRRARELAATIGPVDYESILERDGLWCYLCEVGITTDDLHFDHVIPLARGGSHTADNIRPTHAKCNLRKGVRLVTA